MENCNDTILCNMLQMFVHVQHVGEEDERRVTQQTCRKMEDEEDGRTSGASRCLSCLTERCGTATVSALDAMRHETTTIF